MATETIEATGYMNEAALGALREGHVPIITVKPFGFCSFPVTVTAEVEVPAPSYDELADAVKAYASLGMRAHAERDWRLMELAKRLDR